MKLSKESLEFLENNKGGKLEDLPEELRNMFKQQFEQGQELLNKSKDDNS